MDADGKNARAFVTGSFGLGSVRLQGDGKFLYFVADGKLKRVSVPRGGSPSEVSWKAKLVRDEREVQKEALRQGWAALDERFYDQQLHGTDWDAKYERYAAFCDGTLPAADFNHLAGRLIGELNASHLGCHGGPSIPGLSTATVGITPDADHAGPGIKIADVMPDSPADKPGSKLEIGEYVMSIDGEEIGNTERAHDLLNGRAGERVKLMVNSEPTLEGAREISIKPISMGACGNLRYERWVADSRARVERWSKGRVYYLHIAGMDQASLTRFKREIYGQAQNHDALLIDVRNNGGGNTHDQVLEILTKEVHAWTGQRGAPLHASPRSQFDGPEALLINESSASDAEILPNAFREKGLGTIIGMTTAGAVIGTLDITLVNGHRFRVPVSGWFTNDGANLENLGVPPDIEVAYPYEAYRDGKDPQLRRAVEVLTKQLEKGGRVGEPAVSH